MNRYLVLLGALTAVSCSGGEYEESSGAAYAPSISMAQESRVAPAPSPAMKMAADMPAPEEAPSSGGAYLAYTHNISLETANTQVSPLMKAHLAKCQAMGPAECVITGSNIQTWDEYSTSATLHMRIVPDKALSFLEDVREDAKAAEGRVVSQQTSVDDLTRSIIDTDARLNAQKTLRDRLTALLESQPGNLKELIEIERELARVQGQIDSLTSTLKAMRARVDMSAVTVNYQSRVKVEAAPLQPLKSAFGAFFANFAEALAAIVTFFAYALPWTVALILLLFVVRLLWPMLGIRFRRKT